MKLGKDGLEVNVKGFEWHWGPNSGYSNTPKGFEKLYPTMGAERVILE